MAKKKDSKEELQRYLDLCDKFKRKPNKEEMEENYELYSDLISLISEVEELINIDRKIDL